MSQPTHRIVILAAIDQTQSSEQVLHTTTSLAQKLTGAELHFVTVVPPSPGVGVTINTPNTAGIEAAHTYVSRIVEAADECFHGHVHGHVRTGDPRREILQLASLLETDLIVVGTNNKGRIERFVLGSVSEGIVKNALCAVLVARPKEHDTGPEIEPPCPRCVETQAESHGEKLWCAKHAEPRTVRGRIHYSRSEPFAVGSMLFRPES